MKRSKNQHRARLAALGQEYLIYSVAVSIFAFLVEWIVGSGPSKTLLATIFLYSLVVVGIGLEIVILELKLLHTNDYKSARFYLMVASVAIMWLSAIYSFYGSHDREDLGGLVFVFIAPAIWFFALLSPVLLALLETIQEAFRRR